MKARPFFYVLALATAVVIWIAATTFTAPAPADETPTTPEPSTTTVKLDKTVQGKTATQWHRAAQKYLSRRRSLQHAIRTDPEVSTAIGIACTVYRVSCATLWSKARCESRLWRYAHNPSGASGLFQFLPGTWRSTPFARFSVWDPYAASAAAAWMHVVGRGEEWVC
jgi:hypothetical protein